MPLLALSPRPLVFASLALLLSASANATDHFLLGAYEGGQACTQMNQLVCWRNLFTNAPMGRAPGEQDWVYLGGDHASQAASRSDRFQVLSVIWLPSFLHVGSIPSNFTQHGSMWAQVLSVEEGRYTVAGGLGTFGMVQVGSGSLQGRRNDGVLRTPVLEILGGRLVTHQRVQVGDDAFNLDARSSGEVRLVGGTLDALGGLTGAGSHAQHVSSTLLMDGGTLNTPFIRSFTDLRVGSTAGRVGTLSLASGQTADTRRLAVGRNGGRGSLVVVGDGAQLTAHEALIGAGLGGLGHATVGSLGRMELGTLRLADAEGSTGRLALLGNGASVAVAEGFTLGAGGEAYAEAKGGAQLTTGDARVGAAPTGRGELLLAGAGTLWRAGAVELGVTGSGRLTVEKNAALEAAALTVGDHGALLLGQGSVQAAALQVAADALVSVDFFGPEAATDHGQLLGDGSLHFDGQLQLNFVNGFRPAAGTRFQLFSFTSYGGRLDAGHISVTGFDAGQLNFSQLMIDGSFSVSAVPEPGAWALWLLGIGAMGARVRQRLA